jgi:hypothetical protein
MVLQSGTFGFYETNSMSQRGVGFKKKTGFLRELFFIVSESLYIFPEPAGERRFPITRQPAAVARISSGAPHYRMPGGLQSCMFSVRGSYFFGRNR